MRRKSITALLILIATLNCYGLVGAEIMTYTDQCLSFQYDDEMQGTISKMVSPSGIVSYSLNTANEYVSAAIALLPEDGIDGVICDKEEDYYKQTVIADNEIETHYNDDGSSVRTKVIAVNETQYACISYPVDELSEYSQTFIDSVQIDDSFIDGYVFEELETEYPMFTKIFRNKCYSEQAVVYADQALQICKQYLAFEIDGKEACSKMEELEKRVESYAESTENHNDSDVKSAIFLLNLDFSMNDDADVIQARDELQAIVNAGAAE